MERAEDFSIVYVTIQGFEKAQQMSKVLVTEKFAACCTIIQNVNSIYAWQDAIQERFEYLIMIKTMKKKVEGIKQRIIELHPDEVPEIVSVKMESGFQEYLKWIKHCIDGN